jgi:hypothetical protein
MNVFTNIIQGPLNIAKKPEDLIEQDKLFVEFASHHSVRLAANTVYSWLLKHSFTRYRKKYNSTENKICRLEPNDKTLNILFTPPKGA